MGYTALVTSANRDIGLGLVEQLASNPSIDIIFAAARNPAASSLVQLQRRYPSKIHPIPLEIINEDSAKQAVEQVSSILSPHRGLDILINNAGINQSYFGPIATTPLQDFTQTFQVNLLGVQNVTSQFLPLLRKGELKTIVDVSTFLASVTFNDGRWRQYAIHAYNVSKAAVNFLVRTYAVELAEEGFRVVAVNPGYVKTDMSPAGVLSVEESARGILEVGLSETTENGEFYQWDGSKHPW